MSLQDILESLLGTIQDAGVDLSSIHDAAGLAAALDASGIDISGLSNDQLDYLLDHLPDAGGAAVASTGAAPLKFGSWEKWPSGYWYERDPDGNYTGNWGS